VSDGKPTFLVQQNPFIVPGKDAEALVPVLHWDVVRLGDGVVLEERLRAFHSKDGDFEEDGSGAGVEEVQGAGLSEIGPHRQALLLVLAPLFLSQLGTGQAVGSRKALHVLAFRPRRRGGSSARGTGS